MSAPRTTTITNILQNPGTGKPIVGKTVSIRLNVPGFVNGGSTEKRRSTYATTDATGEWSAVLEVNADIDPAGTYYTVSELGTIWPFVVPFSASPLTLRACLVTDPANPDPLTAGVALPVNQTPGDVATVAADGNSVEWDTATGGVQSVVAGTGVTVDDTDPANPVISSTATGGVSSFNTRTGVVSLTKGDVTATGLAAADVGADTATLRDAAITTAVGTETTARTNADALLIPLTQKAAVNGVASLDGTGKLPSGQLPSLRIAKVTTVASQAAMLALAADDDMQLALRSDSAGTSNPTVYALNGGADPTVLGNWQAFPVGQSLTGAELLVHKDAASGYAGLDSGGLLALAEIPTSIARDSAVVHNTGAESVAGVKTFGSLPVLPGNPTTALQATPKQYVDGLVLPATFVVTAYGAKADAQTYWTGAMTSGSAVLTDTTTHPFTSADVGKRVVVNNAAGAGVHLYTTISAFTDSSHVTLAANATAAVATALYTFGTDDKAAWDAAFAAVPATGGQVIAPGSPSLVYGAITVPTACSVKGTNCSGTGFGLTNLPLVAPFLTGSVLVQAKSGDDGFNGTLVGQAVHFENIGVYFAGMFTNTGHGFSFSSTVNGGGGLLEGLQGANWRNVHVYGHSGTKYAYNIVNPLFFNCNSLYGYGGGGLNIQNNSGTYAYGNSVLSGLYFSCLTGSLNAYNVLSTLGAMNLLTFIRPQSIPAQAGTTFSAWGLSAWGGLDFDSSSCSHIYVVAGDFEVNGAKLGLESEITHGGFVLPPAGYLKDSAPLGRIVGNRRVNTDGSVSLDTAESAGTSLWLMQDNTTAKGSGQRWSIATDGTRRFSMPGVLRVVGNLPSSAAGANNGTSPPSPNLTGTDVAGGVVFGSGSSSAAGAQVAVTFSVAYEQQPTIILTANNAATQALGLYVSGRSASGFTISSANAPTASQAIGTFDVSYTVIGGQPPAITPPVSDAFTRADSTTSLGTADVGGAWTALAGTWGISSNQGYLVSGTGLAHIDSAKADCKIQVALATVSGVNSGIGFRIVDASNYWLASGQQLWKVQAGSFTAMGGTYTPFTSGQTMQVICNGSSIAVLKNGVVVATAIDSFQSTATKHGLRCDQTANRFDNFVVG